MLLLSDNYIKAEQNWSTLGWIKKPIKIDLAWDQGFQRKKILKNSIHEYQWEKQKVVQNMLKTVPFFPSLLSPSLCDGEGGNYY